MYYRHNTNSVIIEKSDTPLEGDNVLEYHEDFDLDLFRVVVGYSYNGAIIKYTKFLDDVEAVSRKLEEINVNQLLTSVETDYRLSMLELGLV